MIVIGVIIIIIIIIIMTMFVILLLLLLIYSSIYIYIYILKNAYRAAERGADISPTIACRSRCGMERIGDICKDDLRV